ncbi:MAG: RagB/SusD family nutrient uptake outer membrane protein [Bacteroidota bacterium]
MKRNIYAILCLIWLFAPGCEDLLEEEVFTFQAPKDYYSNENEVIAAVNGIYDALMTWELWVQPAWVSNALENDDMFALDWVAGGYSGVQNGSWYIERPWNGFYQVVNRTNVVMEQVEPLDFLDADVKNAVLGQAYFLRGYCYYEIGRRFADAPIRTTAFDPANDSQDIARSPLAEVYAQAAADLEMAANLLPEDFVSGAFSDADRGRPTAPSAWGLLTKVYMHMAGAEVNDSEAYTKAIAAAQKAVDLSLKNGFPILEPAYMDNFDQATQDLSEEMLFSIQATQQPNEGPELPRYYVPGNTPFAGGGGIGAIMLREDFYKTFEKNDKRVEFGTALFDEWSDLTGEKFYNFRTLPSTVVNIVSENVVDNGFGRTGNNQYLLMDGTEVNGTPSIFIKKYMDENSQVKDENGSNPIILRYADVLLLLAEAENEQNGPTTLAYEMINQVRARAGLAELSPGLDQMAFREAVRLERRHELYGEFQRRWDLRRWGIWLETMNAANRPRLPYQELFPISASEIAANALINENNPGW